MIFNSTTSSPEESLGSNLQCETVLLSSRRATSRATELGEMRPQVKNLWREERAADVMGPVERGDRMIAKKGPSIVGRGTVATSKDRDEQGARRVRDQQRTFHVAHGAPELLESSHEVNLLIQATPILDVVHRRRHSETHVPAQRRVSRVHEIRRRRPSRILPHRRGDGKDFRVQDMLLGHRAARRRRHGRSKQRRNGLEVTGV